MSMWFILKSQNIFNLILETSILTLNIYLLNYYESVFCKFSAKINWYTKMHQRKGNSINHRWKASYTHKKHRPINQQSIKSSFWIWVHQQQQKRAVKWDHILIGENKVQCAKKDTKSSWKKREQQKKKRRASNNQPAGELKAIVVRRARLR